MSASINIILYTTLGCHLCDNAKSALWQAQEVVSFAFSEVDIATSDTMIAAYGHKIPVLAVPNKNDELCWPFDASDIAAFIADGQVG